MEWCLPTLSIKGKKGRMGKANRQNCDRSLSLSLGSWFDNKTRHDRYPYSFVLSLFFFVLPWSHVVLILLCVRSISQGQGRCYACIWREGGTLTDKQTQRVNKHGWAKHLWFALLSCGWGLRVGVGAQPKTNEWGMMFVW